MSFNTNLNRNFFKRYVNVRDANNENRMMEFYDQFAEECVEIARKLMITEPGLKTPNMEIFDLDVFSYDYLVKNLNNSNANSGNIKLLLEKYILDTVYGKGRMNNKFNMKHKGTPAQKVAMLQKISRQMTNPANWGPRGFNWDNLNDPDFYNTKSIPWYGYENGYAESLNGRIAGYKRMMNKKN